MELIDKTTVITEIEKRFDEYSSSILKHYDACTEARASELGKILIILNALEVKKVDLDNEITDYINKHYHIRCDETLERGNDPLTTIDFEKIAKYFFELGLKAQKDLTN